MMIAGCFFIKKLSVGCFLTEILLWIWHYFQNHSFFEEHDFFKKRNYRVWIFDFYRNWGLSFFFFSFHDRRLLRVLNYFFFNYYFVNALVFIIIKSAWTIFNIILFDIFQKNKTSIFENFISIKLKTSKTKLFNKKKIWIGFDTSTNKKKEKQMKKK